MAEGHSPTRATGLRSQSVRGVASDEHPARFQQSKSRDKLGALIADLNERASSPDRPSLRLPTRSASPQLVVTSKPQTLPTRSASPQRVVTSEPQTLEIERLRAWLASAKQGEEYERSLRLELQQRAFEEVAAATAATGIAEAEQRRREMETDSRQDAEWRLAVAQHQLAEAEKRLQIEMLRRQRLQEQEVVVVDQFGESHSFYPNQDMVTDSEWEYSETSDYDSHR